MTLLHAGQSSNCDLRRATTKGLFPRSSPFACQSTLSLAMCVIVFACFVMITFAPGGNALEFVAKPQQFITVAIGLNMHINCTTDDAQATVKLFQYNYPGAPTKERVVTPGKLMKTDQTFTVINVNVSDGGYYMCQANNVNDTIKWPTGHGLVFIIPNVLPPLKVEPSTAQNVMTGQSIKLICYSEGAKSTTLTWYKIVNKQDVQVSSSQVKVVKTDSINEIKSILTIANAKKEDSGRYKCLLYRNGQTKSAFGAIEVPDPEISTIEPYNGQTDVTAPFEKRLPCVVKGIPAPVITWYKDGKLIILTNCTDDFGSKVCENEVYVIRQTSSVIYVDSSLKIKQTQYPRDQGTYTCKAKNDVGTATLTIKLNVQVAPKLIKIKNNFIVKEQVATNVSCKVNVSATNPLPEFEWFYQEKSSDCPAIQNCKPSEDRWEPLCTQYPTIDPASGQTEISVVRLREDNPSMHYLCMAKNSVGNDTNVLLFYRRKSPNILFKEDNLRVTKGAEVNKTCKATGAPLPTVQWQKKKGKNVTVLAEGQGKAQLSIKSVGEEDFGTYYCVANNSVAVRNFTMKLTEVSGNTSLARLLSNAQLTIAILSGCVAAVVVVVIISCVIWWRQRKQIKEYRGYLKEGEEYEVDPNRSLLEQCNDLPYDANWEFPRDHLVMGEILGTGAFGQVVKAEAIGILGFDPRDKTRKAHRFHRLSTREARKGKLTSTIVAVKTLKEGARESEYKDLATELKILIHIGPHRNIVNLLGACTRGKRLMVIMEFAPHGSLLSFLRSRRDIFDAKWTKTSSDPTTEWTLADLVISAYQVSKGFEFLTSKKCVHRDVAARNVLVGQEGDVIIMKIADFGLARDIYKDDLYVMDTNSPLPLKWMAPESLNDRNFTEKTDVWSFGILMWEMFTLGRTPYPGLPTEQLLTYLTEGKRMDQPQDCPVEVYTLMRDCWMYEPEGRPNFECTTKRLGDILEKKISQDNLYVVLTADKPDSKNYYLLPCDENKEPGAPTPGTASAHPGSEDGYKGPLPIPPTQPPDMSDEETQKVPLLSTPSFIDEAVQGDHSDPKGSRARQTDVASSTGAGMGINIEDPAGDVRDGEKLLMIETDYVPSPKFTSAGNEEKVETTV